MRTRSLALGSSTSSPSSSSSSSPLTSSPWCTGFTDWPPIGSRGSPGGARRTRAASSDPNLLCTQLCIICLRKSVREEGVRKGSTNRGIPRRGGVFNYAKN